MGVRTEDLNVYLLKAWKNTQDDRRFPQAWKNMQDPPLLSVRRDLNIKPFLRSDQTNHIIIYPGAFNPPHRAHVDVLKDGFYNSGPGLNIVAVFVAPTGEDRLHAKENDRKGSGRPQNQVFFSQRQRAGLLKGHLYNKESVKELACKTQVWAFPSLDPCERYMREVKQLAAKDGFTIELLSLKGADHLLFDKPIKHSGFLDCEKIIFSEASRVNEDAWTNGRPTPLKGGWSPWSGVSRVTGPDGVTHSVWQCTLANPAVAARLLADDNKSGKFLVSSTEIRNMIMHPQGMDSRSLEQKLEHVGALCPDKIVKYLVEKKKHSDKRST